jgi:restriction endonuclease Mrr
MDIVPFTVVGTTQKKSECSDELLSCFSLILSLQSYSPEALEKIAQRIAALGNLEVELDARRLIAANSGCRPHQVEVTMQRIARAVKKQRITAEDTVQAFAAFGMRVHADAETGDLANLDLMSGVEFERLVTSLLARMEFRPEMTKATGDGGIDIVAVLDKPILGGSLFFNANDTRAIIWLGRPR